MAKIEIELADGGKAGETLLDLTKKANTLNKEIKKLKPGSEEFISKSKELQGVSSRIGDVKNQIKGTTEASDKLKEAFFNIIPFGGQFKSLAGQVSGAKNSVGGLTSSAGMLRKAMLAIPILAIIAAITSLVSWFTSTQEGMDKVTSVTRPLLAVFEKMKGVVQELGGSVFKGLAQILNGDFKEGLKTLGQGFVDVIGNTRKAIEEGWVAGKRLDDLQKQIEKSEIKQIVRSKELELVIKRQKALVEDETKSYEERIRAAERARGAQDEFEKNALALLDLKIAKIKEQQALNDTSREDEKELAELQAQRLEVQARVTEQSIEFDKKINELRKKQELEAQQQLSDGKVEIEKGQREEIKQLDDLEKRRIMEKYQQDLLALETKLAEEQNIINENLLNRKIDEGEFILNSGENVVDFHRQKIELVRGALGEESLVYQHAYADFLDAQLNFNDQSKSAMNIYVREQIEAVTGSLGVMAGFMGSMSDLFSQGTSQYKAFATAAAIIGAIQGAINAYSSAAAIPFVGSILAPIAGAAALAAGYVQVRKIQNTEVPMPIKTKSVKKEKGGMLYGPSHAKGGIPIEAEGGEFIFSRKSVKAIGVGELTRINDYHTKYAIGGPINPLSGDSETGLASKSSSSGKESLSRPPWVDDLIAAQDRRMDRLKVINVVTETAEGIKTVNQIVEEANV